MRVTSTWWSIAVITAMVTVGLDPAADAAAVLHRDVRWSSAFNGRADLNDVATSVAVGPGGNRVFVTGSTITGPRGPQPFDTDFMTIAYAARTGRVLWRARYDGPARSDDGAVALAVSPSGSTVYVTGSSDSGAGPLAHHEELLITIAYDAADGSEKWSSRYSGPPGEDENAVALALDNGSVYVAATGESSDDATMVTVAYEAGDGALRWVARSSGASTIEVAQDLAVSTGDHEVFVTGSEQSASAFDALTVAYNAKDGSERWRATYDGAAHLADGALAVSAASSGVFATAESASPSGLFDFATLSYDPSSGTQRWVARYKGPGGRDDIPWDVVAGPAGTRVYVTGASVGGGGGFDFETIAYGARSGDAVWRRRYAPPQGGDDVPCCVALNADGSRVYVGGTAVYPGVRGPTLDFAVVAYTAGTGERRWLGRFDGPIGGHDHLHALAAGGNGRVYVTGDAPGRRVGVNPLDYATVAF